MRRIGISGSYGGLNIGDEAILTCTIAQLRSLVPHAEIVIFSRNADYTRQNYEVDRAVTVRQITRKEIIPEVQQLDLLLLGGGGILYDDEAYTFLREVRIAQQFNIPTFCYAIGAGPLVTPEARQAVREVLTQMNGITVRSIKTKQLLEEVGVDQDIVVTADPALLLTPQPFTDEMLMREGICTERPLIGFSIREPGGAAPGLDESAYHMLIADAADFVARRIDADIVFVPMERKDICHAHQVIAQMVAADRAFVLKQQYQPRQILGLTQRFEMVVGMRLHFLIFAAISSVPFLALPYASKVTSFIQALGLPPQTLVQERQAGLLLADIDWLWDNRHKRRELLREQVPRLQELARQTPILAVQLLERYTSIDIPLKSCLPEISLNASSTATV